MGGARISEYTKSRCRFLWQRGMSISAVARETGVSTTTVRNVTKGLSRLVVPSTDNGEEWACLSEIDDHYYISSHGDVFTNGKYGEVKFFDIKPTKYVRQRVALCGPNGPDRYLVDRLVATHFCDGHTAEKDTVIHLDGNVSNNRADNLAWAKGSDDSIVKWKHGLGLTDKDASYVIEQWRTGRSVRSIAVELGVADNKVFPLLNGLTRDVKPPCEPGEKWAKLGDPKGRYYVSSHGRVFTNGGEHGEAKLMKAQLAGPKHKREYLSVTVDDGDGRRRRTIHRLVAKYFCDGWSPENNVVNHKDGNPKNNHADNLEWCTQSDNIRHAIHVLGKNVGGDMTEERKRKISASRRANPNSQRKLTAEQVREIRKDPRSARKLAVVYGVDKATIARARSWEFYAEVE